MSCGIFKNICLENSLQIVIKTSMAEFIFSKVSCFQHILLKTFRRMPVKYENDPLRDTEQKMKESLMENFPVLCSETYFFGHTNNTNVAA